MRSCLVPKPIWTWLKQPVETSLSPWKRGLWSCSSCYNLSFTSLRSFAAWEILNKALLKISHGSSFSLKNSRATCLSTLCYQVMAPWSLLANARENESTLKKASFISAETTWELVFQLPSQSKRNQQTYKHNTHHANSIGNCLNLKLVSESFLHLSLRLGASTWKVGQGLVRNHFWWIFLMCCWWCLSGQEGIKLCLKIYWCLT